MDLVHTRFRVHGMKIVYSSTILVAIQVRLFQVHVWSLEAFLLDKLNILKLILELVVKI